MILIVIFLVKSCSKETKEQKEIFRNFGLMQLIDKATRTAKESSTLLDLFASNPPVVASSLSNHDMFFAVRKINACKLPLRTIECRNYAKYNPSTFCDNLRDIPWDDVLKERNVNTAWSNWKELFLNVCDRHAPYKRKIVRGVKCPWLTGETKKLMNQRTFSYEKQEGLELRWTGMLIGYYEIKCQIKSGMKNVAIIGMKFRKILIALKPFGKNLSRPRRDIQLLISQLLPRSLIISLQTPSLSFWKPCNSH